MKTFYWLLSTITLLALIVIPRNSSAAPEGELTRTQPPTASHQSDSPTRPSVSEYRVHTKRKLEYERLMAAISVEGPVFSEKRLRAYRWRMFTGASLTAVGGIGMFVGILGFTISAGTDNENNVSGWSTSTGLFFGASILSIAAFTTGLILAVSARRGKYRQKLLRRQDEIISDYQESEKSMLGPKVNWFRNGGILSVDF